MGGEGGTAARARRAPAGRAPELRLPAARAAIAAGRGRGPAAQVLACAPASRRLPRAGSGGAAGGGDLLRVRRRLGPGDPARLRAARRRQAGAGRHPAERATRACERLARVVRAPAARAPGGGRPGATAARRPAVVDPRARAAFRHPLPRALRRALDGPSRRVDRLRHQHGYVRAHSGGRPSGDLPRDAALAAARRRLQLPRRPAGPLRLLRPGHLALQLPPLLRRCLAGRELAAPLPEPAALARLRAARAGGRARARLGNAVRAQRGGSGGAAVAVARRALSRIRRGRLGRHGAVVRGPAARLSVSTLLDLGSMVRGLSLVSLLVALLVGG